MFVVRLVQTLAQWQALQPVWQALVNADTRASLCTTWEWNDAWMQQFWQPHFTLHVIVVQRAGDQGDATLALLPLYVNQLSCEATLIGSGEPEQSEVASEYLDLVLDESKCQLAEIVPVLRDALSKVHSPRICFPNCLASSRLQQLVSSLSRTTAQLVGRQFGVALSQSLPELIQQFSYKQRKNGQLLLNRFDKNPAFTFAVMVDGASEELWRHLQQLHQADWTARQQQGAFASEDFLLFHQRLQQGGGAVQARFAVLKHEQEVIAVNYYYQFRQQLYYYQSGTVKDRFQQYSPGKMLHMLAFRELAGSGLYYDFMKGALQGSYKAAMCPEGEVFYDLAVYQGGVTGTLRWMWSRLKRKLKLKLEQNKKVQEPQAD